MNSLKSQIYSNGNLLSSNILSIDITNSVNKIPFAQVILREGSKDEKSIAELSVDSSLQPGEEIELSLSKDNSTYLFKGIVIKQKIKRTSDGSFLIVDIKDKAVKLTLQRKSALYENKEDKEIITEIANNSQVNVECNEPTYKNKQIIQYYCTNWDFIISRIEANGLLAFIENGVMQVKKPDLTTASKQLSEIHEFEMEADMSNQYNEVESVCWDIKEVCLGKYKNTNTVTLNGEHDFDSLSQAMGTESLVVTSGVYAEKDEMEMLANAQLMKNRFSMLRGRLALEGNPDIKVGDNITVSEAGEIFNSTTIVSGIRHRITKDGWYTDLQCGLSADWFYKKDDIIDKPAAGLLPGINGLHVGIVETLPSDGDPEKFKRIKVRIPAVADQESVIWARLLFPYAGNQRGMFFVPEAGDEVVIGFFNDDPRHAVVLGALYNGKTEIPYDLTENNNVKGFVSRNGIKVTFTDEQDKEKLEISTPAGNKIFCEDEKGIVIEDKNSNNITFNDNGVQWLDKNKNKILTDDKGITVEDSNKNKLIFNNKGVELKDLNNNIISLSSQGIEIKDKNGNKTILDASGVKIISGTDAVIEGKAKVAVKGSQINMN